MVSNDCIDVSASGGHVGHAEAINILSFKKFVSEERKQKQSLSWRIIPTQHLIAAKKKP